MVPAQSSNCDQGAPPSCVKWHTHPRRQRRQSPSVGMPGVEEGQRDHDRFDLGIGDGHGQRIAAEIVHCMGPNCNGPHKKEAKEAVRTYTQTKPAIFEFSSRWAFEFADAKPLDAAPASPEGSSPITTPFSSTSSALAGGG